MPFLGWRIVILCGVLRLMTAPGQTTGVSVLIDPMMVGLGLSRLQVSTAYLIGTVAGATTQPLFGRMFDRCGPRKSAMIISAAFGFALLFMAGVTGFVTLCIGFCGIRALGQGGLSLVAGTTPVLWFHRYRGFAVALSTAIGSAGSSLVPVVTILVIMAAGWRATWIIYALIVVSVVQVLARWGLIDRPADVGQGMDGIPPQSTSAIATEQKPEDDGAGAGQPTVFEHNQIEKDYTRAEAMRTPMFWALSSVIAVAALITTALTFHQISLLSEQGLSTVEAAANFVPQTFAALVATLIAGSLIDRFRQRYLLVIMTVLMALSMVGVQFVQPGLLALLYGIVLGAAQGTMRLIAGASYSKLFGVRAAGEIGGVVKAMSAGASAIGPAMLALGFAATGSYRQVLLMLLVLPAASTLFALLAPDLPVPEAGDGQHLNAS